MFSDEDKLDNIQVDNLVKQYIKRTKGNINIDKNSSFYKNLQVVASELGYIEKPKYTQSILSYNDMIKCVEQIWNYVMEGVLAPGSPSGGYNYFFPYMHLTDKGKKELENW